MWPASRLAHDLVDNFTTATLASEGRDIRTVSAEFLKADADLTLTFASGALIHSTLKLRTKVYGMRGGLTVSL